MSTMTTTEAVTTAELEPGKGWGRKKLPAVEGRAVPAFYWMVWPALILFAAFHTLPVLVGVFFSFTNYAGFGAWEFVGLSNYVTALTDPLFWQTTGITVFYMVATVAVELVIGFAFAVKPPLFNRCASRSIDRMAT